MSLWKHAPTCSEVFLEKIALDFAAELRPGDRVILGGCLGAGKSTFARHVLRGLGAKNLAEGSPTFSIAHEYLTPSGPVTHIDLYRLDSIQEVEDAGLMHSLWDHKRIVLVEWLSQIPELELQITDPIKATPLGFRNWVVNLEVLPHDENSRKLEITQP